MELDRIEKLLEKYFEATATVSEEETLRNYFSGDGVASHLEQYAPMFHYFEEARGERSAQRIQLGREPLGSVLSGRLKSKSSYGKPSRKLWYTWGAVAAMLMILVGVYFSFDAPMATVASKNDFALLEDEYTQEEIVAAQEALALLSTNFSKGTEQLSYLNEFEKNTNRFLNENNITKNRSSLNN